MKKNDTVPEGTVVDCRIYPEAHYNHYGSRGVADLYIQKEVNDESGYHRRLDSIYEIKSESAIQQASGANEIIRQYNRMREHFYKDESRDEPELAFFELVIIPSTVTIDHFIQNFELYKEVSRNELNPEPLYFENICFRHPKDWDYIEVFKENPEDDAVEALEQLCDSNKTDIANRVKDILRSLGH